MKRFTKHLLFAGACATVALSGEAFAQTGSAVEEVVVTGSRIKRADITGVGPATVVTEEAISRTGVMNVETLLQRLTASAATPGTRPTPTGPATAGAPLRSTCAAWASTGRSSC